MRSGELGGQTRDQLVSSQQKESLFFSLVRRNVMQFHRAVYS